MTREDKLEKLVVEVLNGFRDGSIMGATFHSGDWKMCAMLDVGIERLAAIEHERGTGNHWQRIAEIVKEQLQNMNPDVNDKGPLL